MWATHRKQARQAQSLSEITLARWTHLKPNWWRNQCTHVLICKEDSRYRHLTQGAKVSMQVLKSFRLEPNIQKPEPVLVTRFDMVCFLLFIFPNRGLRPVRVLAECQRGEYTETHTHKLWPGKWGRHPGHRNLNFIFIRRCSVKSEIQKELSKRTICNREITRLDTFADFCL